MKRVAEVVNARPVTAGRVRVRPIGLVTATLVAALLIAGSASNALAAGGSISGQITNSVTHVGIAGAKVQFYDLISDSNFPVATATADATSSVRGQPVLKGFRFRRRRPTSRAITSATAAVRPATSTSSPLTARDTRTSRITTTNARSAAAAPLIPLR
jgi:hypothetical protein